MKRQFYRYFWFTLLTLPLLLTPVRSSAGTATEQVKETADEVLAILKNSQLKSQAKSDEREERLKRVVRSRFDFAEMAKRSLGAHWGRRSQAEQQEFVKSFADLLMNSYIDQIESYNGEKIVYLDEKQERDHAQVNTKIQSRTGEEYAVDYRLHQVNTEWKVYDLVIQNISVVNNYRSQFARLMNNGSFQELLQRMTEKGFQTPKTK